MLLYDRSTIMKFCNQDISQTITARCFKLGQLIENYEYGKCSKISNTLKLRTPKIIAENNFKNIQKNRTLTFFEKVNF